MTTIKKMFLVLLALVLTFLPALSASADDGIDWPRGSYYNPYESIKELPEVVGRYDISPRKDAFSSTAYFYVTEEDLDNIPGTVIKAGATEDKGAWRLSVPVVHNAEMLEIYCRQNNIVLLMCENISDKSRVTLLGLDREKLSETKILLTGQSVVSNSIFEIEMSGINKLGTKNPIHANVWIVNNLGSFCEGDFIYESGIGSETVDPISFTENEVTLSLTIEDCAIECIERYIEGAELG